MTMDEQAAVPVADTGEPSAFDLEPDQIPTAQREPEPPEEGERWRVVLADIMGGSIVLSILAVFLSLVVGAILIAVVNPQVQAAASYFFSRPGDTFAAIWQAVSGAYLSLFQGGVYDYTATSFAEGIKPLLASLGFATPLIAAGLGIAVAFRAGMFNIGGQGQLLLGGALAGYVGFAWPLPFGIHLLVALIAALVGGAVWAGIAGVLKATTGAHEVIVTIMLNYVALYLISYLLQTPVLQAKGSNNPQSPAELPSAVLPNLLGANYAINLGFILVIVATIISWWLLGRSSLGFKFRAVGENPNAARVAGISVKRIYIYAMLVSGALVGFAGAYQVLGQISTGFTNDLDAGIGFNAITVALLGRSRPWGVFWAGILFGVFQAGGYTMQAAQNVDIDIVSVVQSVIVLFIAAPPLVRAIFRLPTPGARRAATRRPKEAISK
jgi:ABC-type uncharacterized transport system permease subunit